MFRLPRDRSSVMAIGRQIYPENPGALLEAYSKALADHEREMDSKYGYLFIDATVGCGKRERAKSLQSFPYSKL